MENSLQNNRRETEMVEVDIRRIFNAVINNIWRIGIITLLCGMLFFLGSYLLLTPQYQSSVMFYVNNNTLDGDDVSSITSSDLLTSKNLVNSYIVVLKTRTVLTEVIEYAGINRSYEQLSGMVSAETLNNTEAFRVTVLSTDPEEASIIANAIAHVVPIRVSEIIKGSSAIVVDDAVTPKIAFFPNHTKNTLLGFIIGLVASVAIVVLSEVFDITIRNEDDVKGCCRYQVLASVPDMNKSSGRGYYYRRYYRRYSYYNSDNNESNSTNDTVINFVGKNVDFAAAEAYKLLRTKLLYSFADDQSCHVFAVSSALAGEGKSVSSVNLAYSFAQLNKRVLLIDCDMRRPTLAKKMGLTKYPGLSEYLTGFLDLEELFQQYSDGGDIVPITVLTAGNTPPNPVELMNSDKMARAIETLRKKFDYIIMDMPPIGDVSDALISAKLADGVLMIVRQNYGSRTAVRNAVLQFEFVKAKILGVVLNCMTDKVGSYQNRKYSKHYGYGRGYGYYSSYRYVRHAKRNNDAPVRKDIKNIKSNGKRKK